MLEICFGFRTRGNAEVVGGRTDPQTSELGKDEPHPVAPFAALPQLGSYAFPFGLLRVNEPLQAERIIHIKPGSSQRSNVASGVNVCVDYPTRDGVTGMNKHWESKRLQVSEMRGLETPAGETTYPTKTTQRHSMEQIGLPCRLCPEKVFNTNELTSATERSI
jgi:hypothetical protein